MFGLSFGWSYLLSAFTLTLTACLPLALIVTMNTTVPGPERANALMAWLPIMAGAIAVACAVFFYSTLRHRVEWQRHAMMGMWALSALGIVGWWKL